MAIGGSAMGFDLQNVSSLVLMFRGSRRGLLGQRSLPSSPLPYFSIPLHCVFFICRWVREFLNDENKGLDVLVDYLSFAQCSVM